MDGEEKQDTNVSRETITETEDVAKALSYKKLYNDLLIENNKDKQTIERLTKEKDEAVSTLVSLGNSKKGEEPNEFEKVFGGLKI